MFRSYTDVKITKSEIAKTSKQIEFSCDLCDDGPFQNEVDVEIHRRKTHRIEITHLYSDKNNYMCTVCHRAQNSRSSLIEHIKEAHLCCTPNASRISREIFICDYCNKLFFNKQLLSTHMMYWHLLDKDGRWATKVHCPRCWRTIRVKSLWFHYLHHDMLNISTCPICLEFCTNRVDLIEHIKTHPGHFSCNICGYASTKELYFTAHMEKHKKKLNIKSRQDISRYFVPGKHPSQSRKYMFNLFRGISLANEVQICVICRELCETEKEMKQHILADHAPEEKTQSKKHVCVCGEEFFNSILLKQHIFKLKGHHQALVEGATIEPVVESAPVILNEDHQVVYQLYDMSQVTVDVNMFDSEATNETTENQIILNGFEQIEET